MTDFSEWWVCAEAAESDEPGWRLRHHACGWASNWQDAAHVRSVEDLHNWINAHTCGQAPNTPTGDTMVRQWRHVHAGWFVQTPAGAWFEVVATKLMTGRQMVTLRIGAESPTFPRDPAADVTCRRGARADSITEATAVLEGAFTVDALEDEPPW